MNEPERTEVSDVIEAGRARGSIDCSWPFVAEGQ